MDMPIYSGTQKLVLNEIFTQGQMTRTELSVHLELSGLTISKAVTALLSDGIIVETNSLQSSGGRKPAALSVNPSFAYIIGIDFGCYSFKIGAVALDGSLLTQEKIITYHGKVPSDTLSTEEIFAKIQTLIEQNGEDRLAAICVSVSGMVDYESRSTLFCPNIAGISPHLVSDLEEHFGVQAYLDTSARCMALAERRFGCGRNVDNFIFVPVGFSISSGLIMNGKIFRGASGFAGELGHLWVCDEEETPCTCGNYGCLELFACLPMIVVHVKGRLSGSVYSPLLQSQKDLEAITIEDVAQGYARGDKTVVLVVRDASDKFGRALSYMVNLLNPEMIVFGGGLTEVFPDMIEEIGRATTQHCVTPSASNLRFEKTALGDQISVIGSASQMLDGYFS